MQNTRRALIVDDYPAMLRILRRHLEGFGFNHIDEATEADAALKLARSNAYDLILSDWNMPRMSGLDLLTALRDEGVLTRTPFVFVTARSAVADIRAAKEAGASGYVTKPFDADTLHRKLGFLTQSNAA